jgi:hypothetical protein
LRAFKDYATPVALLILAGVVLFDHFALLALPRPEPAINAQALGRSYAPSLVAGYADAWLAAAKALEDGRSVAEAQGTLQESWKDARVKAFREEVAPVFALVLPEGTEPADAAKRAQVALLWRSFAKGLKGAR